MVCEIWTTPRAAPIFTRQVVTSENVMRVVPTKVACWPSPHCSVASPSRTTNLTVDGPPEVVVVVALVVVLVLGLVLLVLLVLEVVDFVLGLVLDVDEVLDVEVVFVEVVGVVVFAVLVVVVGVVVVVVVVVVVGVVGSAGSVGSVVEGALVGLPVSTLTSGSGGVSTLGASGGVSVVVVVTDSCDFFQNR